MNLQQDTEGYIIILHPSEVIFTLRPEAISETALSFIIKTWARITPIQSSFILYQRLSTYFSTVLLLNFLCWSCITYYFFYNKIIKANFYSAVLKRSFHTTRPLYAPPRDARFINNEQAQNRLRLATEGKYGPGHPVIGETTPIDYRVDGYVTHDQKRGFEILSESVEPSSKKFGLLTMPTSDFHPPIIDSEARLADSTINSAISNADSSNSG